MNSETYGKLQTDHWSPGRNAGLPEGRRRCAFHHDCELADASARFTGAMRQHMFLIEGIESREERNQIAAQVYAELTDEQVRALEAGRRRAP